MRYWFLAAAVVFSPALCSQGQAPVEQQRPLIGGSDRAIDATIAINADYEKLDPIFQAIHPLDVRGKRWVTVSVGAIHDPWLSKGWLIVDRPDAIELLGDDGSIRRFRRPNVNPAEHEGADVSGGENKSETAQSIRDADYARFCEDLMKRDPAIPSENDGVYKFNAERAAQRTIIMHAARCGYWAWQRHDISLAATLDQFAKQALEKYLARYIAEPKAKLPEWVARRVAMDKRESAVFEAARAGNRAELAQRWKMIAEIPGEHQSEARRMVEGYAALIAEDVARKEPSESERKDATVEQQVAYWMYRLRDADVEQAMSPGFCSVLEERFEAFRRAKSAPNPAVELKKLGFAALPQVISHLDDTRPTRCKGHWRSYEPDSFYLLSYGDCCQQIFEAITDYKIFEPSSTNSYPVMDGKEQLCKRRAEQWWQEHRR